MRKRRGRSQKRNCRSCLWRLQEAWKRRESNPPPGTPRGGLAEFRGSPAVACALTPSTGLPSFLYAEGLREARNGSGQAAHPQPAPTLIEGLGEHRRLVVPHPVVEGAAVQQQDWRTGTLVPTEQMTVRQVH